MHARRNSIVVVALCSLFTSVCLLSDAAASEEAREPAKLLAKVEISAGRVDWQPAGNPERLTLTVAGPGGLYIQREFGAGETPFFSSFDLPDGTYAYELRTQGREAQWGHLWVQGGSFMDKIPALPRSARQSESSSKPPLRNVTANTTIPDDLVVQGQACIGSGCVNGDANGPALRLKEGGNYQILFDGLNCCLPSERRWAVQANGSDANGLHGDFMIRDISQGTTPLRIGGSAPDNALTVLYNGNIGLGTLTPATRLDLKANAAGQAAARLQSSSATGYSGIEYLDNGGIVDLYFGIDNAASTTRLNSINNNPIVILTNSAERMRVTSAGNVGIGTMNPGARLEVSGGEVRIPPAGGVPGFTHLNYADGKNYVRGTTIIADTGGSVGIGTSTPSSKLHVNGGDIRVSGGSFIDDGTTLNVPDYVFEPDYRLMPLDQLRAFVAREKHLPNVPSAADVKKEGLNLSQVQMRLLEKLEELTLYTLKQDEQVQALQRENARLSARLETLEQAVTAER